MAKNKNVNGKALGVAAGTAAVLAGYYLFGPKRKQHQKAAKKWAKDAGKGVVAEIKKVVAETEIQVSKKKRG